MVIGGEDSSVGVVAIVKKFGDETELGNNLGFKFGEFDFAKLKRVKMKLGFLNFRFFCSAYG
jgi:hypothetical protein